MANRPSDFFGASPKSILTRPFMHLQDQKASGTYGGDSIAGTQTRVFNTVLHNDITGASLASNQVTLQAGTYLVEASAPAFEVGKHKLRLYSLTTGAYLVEGQSNYCLASYSTTTYAGLKGVITLTAETVLELRHYTQAVRAIAGLGYDVSQGVEVYADLKIWQLDRSLEIAPKAVNSGLQTVPSLDTTGNIMGFDISKTGANEVTVTKGSCLDSTLEVPMALTVDTALAIPAVANTIYHIFIVRLVADGTFTVKAYTSEAGVASDTLVDKWRWIGFWRTNGSSACMEGLLKGGTMAFLKPSETVVASGFASTTFTLLTLTGMIPVSRVDEIYPGIVSATINDIAVSFSLDGTNSITWVAGYNASMDTWPWGYATVGHSLRQIPIDNGVLYAKVNTGSANIGIAQVKLRR